ncbi:MAG: hypothetical protein WBB19_03160 [Desulforhopalus sp.]
MTTYKRTKVLVVLMLTTLLFLSGCANFLQPEPGTIAQEEARFELTEGGLQGAVLDTNELRLVYSVSESGDMFNLDGTLTFDRSLTDSFGVINRFFFKMSFLDGDGRVIQTVDITPLFRSFSYVWDQLQVKESLVKPEGAVFIAFNYFGEFSGSADEMGGDEWEIFYFPYE